MGIALPAFLSHDRLTTPHRRRTILKETAGEPFDRRTHRKRSRIDQAVDWLKECRRLASRFDKLAVNFLALITR